MAKGKRFEDDGPRIHRTDERDDLEKYPGHVYDMLEDELYDDEIEDLGDDFGDEDDYYWDEQQTFDHLGLPSS